MLQRDITITSIKIGCRFDRMRKLAVVNIICVRTIETITMDLISYRIFCSIWRPNKVQIFR